MELVAQERGDGAFNCARFALWPRQSQEHVGSTASAQHYLCFQPPSSEPYFRVSQDTALHFRIAVSMQTSG